MKPDYLPLYRDGSRLLMPDLAEFTKTRAQREKRYSRAPGKASSRLLAWPNARWWRAIEIRNARDLPESRHPQRDAAVQASWKRLGAFQKWDAASFADALHVLIEAPSVEVVHCGPMPEREGDPRPGLGDREAVRAWLVAKASLWGAAIDLLEKDGRLTAAQAGRLRLRRPTRDRCPDLHALVHFHCTADLLSIRWDERVVRSTLPFFRGGSLTKVRKAAAMVEATMAGDLKSVTLLQRFLAGTDATQAAPWLVLAGAVRDPERRRHFIERLAAAEARMKSPHRVPLSLIELIEKRAKRAKQPSLELAGLFTVVERRLDPAIFADGLALAECFPKQRIELRIPKKVDLRPSLDVFLELAGRVVAERAGARRSSLSGVRHVLRLWERALGSRELRRELAAAPWREFPEVQIGDWLDLFENFSEEGTKPGRLPRMIERVKSSLRKEEPAARSVKMETMERLLRWWWTMPSRRTFEDFDAISSTVGRGFGKMPYDAVSLFDDLYRVASPDLRWCLAGLPRSVVKNLEEATRNDNATDQIKRGGQLWLREMKEIDPRIPFRRPKRFIEALRALAGIPPKDAQEICGFLRDHPGFTIDPLRIDLRDACLLFDTILGPGERDPLPAKLREMACGRLSLGEEALKSHRGEFADGLADYQIDLLTGEIQRVEERYRIQGLDPHTMAFLESLGSSNRRAMRRFLNAIRLGDSGYRDRHPANRAWLENRRHLPLSEWVERDTPPFPVVIPGIEGAFVRLEDDPQEELKMGTYFSTCLGVGGCNQHGAVANTLDINKRVAYLRDASGRVLARQLLAISDGNELVPFHIYWRVAKDQMDGCESAFRRFDKHLAGRLGLPLLKNVGEYAVAPLIAKAWYDDGAWLPRE